MAKRAVIGFKGIALAKVTQNDILIYKSEAAKALPYAGKMSRTAKEKKQDIFYEDGLYAQVNEVLGEDVEIRVAEVSLEMMAELGLGTFDKDKQLLEGEFTPRPGTYSLRCVTDTVDKLPYYFNWRAFDLNGIRFDNFSTLGDSIAVCEVIISGVFKHPGIPTLAPYAIKRLERQEDGSDNAAECEAFLKDGETFPKP